MSRSVALYRVKVQVNSNRLTFNGTGSHLWRCKELSGTGNGPKLDPDFQAYVFNLLPDCAFMITNSDLPL